MSQAECINTVANTTTAKEKLFNPLAPELIACTEV
jgi:hypothetical protein